ncbi:hypothetical protein K439DRAFT_1031576 [Ramaria rubella]|nr:hypothetical protein K439DRAFT_1031576 [Ramaria rubella]
MYLYIPLLVLPSRFSLSIFTAFAFAAWFARQYFNPFVMFIILYSLLYFYTLIPTTAVFERCTPVISCLPFLGMGLILTCTAL